MILICGKLKTRILQEKIDRAKKDTEFKDSRKKNRWIQTEWTIQDPIQHLVKKIISYRSLYLKG